MNIKNILLIAPLITLLNCQPEQSKWPKTRVIQRSTAGHVVFEALDNNMSMLGECGSERKIILHNKKDIFIREFNLLLNILTEGDQEEKIRFLSSYIKSQESADKILKTASLIEKYSPNISYFLQ